MLQFIFSHSSVLIQKGWVCVVCASEGCSEDETNRLCAESLAQVLAHSGHRIITVALSDPAGFSSPTFLPTVGCRHPHKVFITSRPSVLSTTMSSLRFSSILAGPLLRRNPTHRQWETAVLFRSLNHLFYLTKMLAKLLLSDLSDPEAKATAM